MSMFALTTTAPSREVRYPRCYDCRIKGLTHLLLLVGDGLVLHKQDPVSRTIDISARAQVAERFAREKFRPFRS
jgi:hypothetical protein